MSSTRLLCVIAAGFLLAATLPLPYGYYTFLRLTVCGIGAYGAWTFWNTGQADRLIAILLAGLALLFNPIVPVHLSREIWLPIDLGAAAIFGLAAWRAKA
jgi:hypothetical protein